MKIMKNQINKVLDLYNKNKHKSNLLKKERQLKQELPLTTNNNFYKKNNKLVNPAYRYSNSKRNQSNR